MGEGAKPPVLASSFGPSPIVRDALRGGLGAKNEAPRRSAPHLQRRVAWQSKPGVERQSVDEVALEIAVELFVPRIWADYTECGRSETIRYDAPLY